MNSNVASLKLQGAMLSAVGGARCSSCGESFENALLAMVFSESTVEEYYACPNCLSKVASIQKPVEVEEPEVDAGLDVDEFNADELLADAPDIDDDVADAGSLAGEVAVEGDVEGPSGCGHHLGYLKKREKNTPIPEECLTCSKMIDCMY